MNTYATLPSRRALTAAAAAAALAAAMAAPAQAVPLVGLTSSNQLARFDSANPGMATMVSITGLEAGERFVGIDLRPSNNMIYGISASNRIYTVNELTGAASFVMALSAPVVDAAQGWGLDFNPVADFAGAASLRLVSSAGGNFAVNVSTGVVGNATNSIAPGYTAVAYSNSNPMAGTGPASTALYYIDSASDTLAVATTAFNTPTINTVGALGIDVLRATGFELTAGNMGFAALNIDDGLLATGLYGINLMTGEAMLKGKFNGTLTGLTVSAVPEPGSYAMMAMGLAGLLLVHRRRARRDTA
jgi:hypothetical protein